MPGVATKPKGLKVKTIDDAVSAFLTYLKSEPSLPASAAKNAETVLNMLRHHLNTSDDDRPDEEFCSQSAPAKMIEHLDRFLRYCVMRELVLTFDQREFVFFVTYDFCEWLHKNKLLTDSSFVKFQLLREQHLDMWQRACTAAHEIAFSLPQRKTRAKNDQTIDFGRHDISQIVGDQIWLEIWSLPLLPVDDHVGPITLPKGIAESLQVGWMITCELAKTKSGWRIVEVGNIYPSLPFK